MTRDDDETPRDRLRKLSDPPPPHSRWWLAHALVDVSTMVVLAFFVTRGLDINVATTLVVGVQAGYLAQLRRGRRRPRSPILALLASTAGGALAAFDVARRWYA